MQHKHIHIIAHSASGFSKGEEIVSSGLMATVHRSPANFKTIWESADALVFIGALGICVRTIAPFLLNKEKDPAVVNIDIRGEYVQSVVSGHIGGANDLAKEISGILGAHAIITTASDTQELWALDMLPKKFNWKLETAGSLTQITALFVNKEPTALLLEARDNGTKLLESEAPAHISIFTKADAINPSDFKLIIAVTPFTWHFGIPTLYYRPAMLSVGVGCQKGIDSVLFSKMLKKKLAELKLSPLSISELGTVDLKSDEKAFKDFADEYSLPLISIEGQKLSAYNVPNPSDKVKKVTGTTGVAEAAAMHLSKNKLLVEKTKCEVNNKFFTFAVAINIEKERKGFVEIVGAGPGDPELVSVKGKRFLQMADLILYAGSLVPKELTYYAKPGCVVKSSAGMDLKSQIDTMKEFYDRGLFVVRLHTGDPCIYGAIQEQMAKMDNLGMDYHITPGISSFQAAAAALKSQFTIPEKVQSIILTRGEGRTPMPEREQLHKLAQSRSTMCIYLSAAIATKVQEELLVHYPPETPVAVCYKLTWKDEKVWRTTLDCLAKTIQENNLSMTTMIVVGESIGNRTGESKLYHKHFSHAYRDGEE